MSPRIAIIGTGAMAHAHARAFGKIEGVELAAAVDMNPDALEPFCKAYNIPHAFNSVEDAVAFGGFDAATVVTPDAFHHSCTMPLLAAGKHVLCEKPLATNLADAEQMREAANAAGVINMVNFTYRRCGALAKAAQMVRDGEIGDIRHFDASYLQDWLLQPGWETKPYFLWRLSTAHGSLGTLGDLGVHILDYTIHASSSSPKRISCRLNMFDKPTGNQIGEYIFDANDVFTMHLEMKDGATGTVFGSRVAAGHNNDLRLMLYGSEGALEVSESDGVSKLKGVVGRHVADQAWQDLQIADPPSLYDVFVAAICTGRPAIPDFAHAVKIQKLLDAAILSNDNQSRDTSNN